MLAGAKTHHTPSVADPGSWAMWQLPWKPWSQMPSRAAGWCWEPQLTNKICNKAKVHHNLVLLIFSRWIKKRLFSQNVKIQGTERWPGEVCLSTPSLLVEEGFPCAHAHSVKQNYLLAAAFPELVAPCVPSLHSEVSHSECSSYLWRVWAWTDPSPSFMWGR